MRREGERFLQTLRGTGNIALACRESGVNRATVYRWRENSERFRLKWDEAITHSTDLLEAEARRRGMSGVDEAVFHRGRQVGTVRKYSDGLLTVLLRAHRPEKFGRKVEIGGPDGGPVPVIFIPDNGRNDGE